jgi:uncharacterized protein (TIGR03437 family)
MRAEPSPVTPGVDQLQLQLPAELEKGDLDVLLKVDGYQANLTRLHIE